MVEGFLHPRFSGVAALFARQLPVGRPGGAALTVYHRGEKVLDLWGGTRDDAGTPWASDTLALSFSTTKGVASTLLHLLADRGQVDYNRPVAHYWPAFGRNGKSGITVRALMCHEAGLHDVRHLVGTARELNDWQHTLGRLEDAAPSYEPGSRNGYHGFTYGFLVGGLVEKVTDRSLPDVLREELTEPLGLDGAYFGLPASEMTRAAHLYTYAARPVAANPTPPGMVARMQRSAIRSTTGEFRRALIPHGMRDFDWNSPEVLGSCNPSATGTFTSRSLARIYAVLAEGGTLEGRRYLSARTLKAMGTRQNKRLDDVLKMPMHWRLGYHRVFALAPSAPEAFGHFGYAGSGAWADPSRRLAMGYTVNSGTGSPVGDLRIMRLTNAALRAADGR